MEGHTDIQYMRPIKNHSDSVLESGAPQHTSAPVQAFNTIINAYLEEAEFQMKMVQLIERHPSFLPPYLEVLEMLEKLEQTDDYVDFLELTYRRLGSSLTSQDAIPSIVASAMYPELLSIKFLLERLRPFVKRDLFMRLSLARAHHVIEEALEHALPEKPSRNALCLDESIDTEEMKTELLEKEHHWFARSERQKTYINHIHTQAVLLRNNKHVSVDPIPVDGPHESMRTAQSVHFQSFLDFTETFAEKHNLGLGRVALVRLRPGKLVYRHCDTEENLRTRVRFHLIVAAEDGNVLILGDELARIHEGQLWRYGNKTMHKSYNESNSWRVNLIFDTFPIT